MAVGEVMESRAAGFSRGDTVSHALGWRDYAVVDPATTQLSGNRVIASAGTEAKVTWLRDVVGVDAFDRRDGDLDAHLHKLAPDGIDVYFDSVGGCHLESAPHALAAMIAGHTTGKTLVSLG